MNTRMETETDELPAPTADALDANEPERFTIDTEERANWLLRKLANIEAEKARVKAQAEAIIRQLDSDAEGLRFLYGSELEHFARQTLASQGNRRKSVKLLQGTLAFRSVPASVKISDPAAALAYARLNLRPAVKTVEQLDTTQYREYAAAMLEHDTVVPGVETTPARESFKIDFGKPSAE